MSLGLHSIALENEGLSSFCLNVYLVIISLDLSWKHGRLITRYIETVTHVTWTGAGISGHVLLDLRYMAFDCVVRLF